MAAKLHNTFSYPIGNCFKLQNLLYYVTFRVHYRLFLSNNFILTVNTRIVNYKLPSSDTRIS